MKVTLISPYSDITSFGLRTISAHLKNHGCTTQILFMPDPTDRDFRKAADPYPETVLDETVKLCRDSDLIGITLMTNYFFCASQITRHLKKNLDVPVIWGGCHPTIRPEECLEFADMVCIGDGEDVMLELIGKMRSGEDYRSVSGLWSRTGTVIQRNPPKELNNNLDTYPFPDYTFNQHFFLDNDRFVSLDYDLTGKFLKECQNSSVKYRVFNTVGYQTMTGRGCPHQCSYCVNDTIKKLYQGQRYPRWRSTSHVMEELVWVKENMPFVGHIQISDDAFLGKSLNKLKEFCSDYKRLVNMPFFCLTSPPMVTEEKLEILIDAGMVKLQMGIQSGSRRMQQLFNRKQMTNDVNMKAVQIINRFRDRMMPPVYDFIIDVPYETEMDVVETLRFVARMPKPFFLNPFSLVLYPGTGLSRMAMDDGLLHDEHQDVYLKTVADRKPTYLNLLLTLAQNGGFPSFLLKCLVSDPVVMIMALSPAKQAVRIAYEGMRSVRKKRRAAAGRH